MSIFVCGDIHGTLDIDKLNRFIGRKDLSKKDYLIICGDTGICGFSKKIESETREFLRKLPMTTLFIDGNHESFDVLGSLPVENWHGGKVHIIEPGIIHLMRGQIYEIEDKRFFTFGGAFSTDRQYRIKGETWFEEELPCEEEYAQALENLQKHEYKVDYMITHTAPYDIVRNLGYDTHEAALKQEKFLKQIADSASFRGWYFGHFHEDVDMGRFHCRMDKVSKLQ